MTRDVEAVNEAVGTLRTIWCTILDLTDVPEDASFFDLGGNSVDAIEAVAMARRAGLNVSARALYASSNLVDLAHASTAVPSAEPTPSHDGVLPLTANQRVPLELGWTHVERRPRMILIEFPGAVDIGILGETLQALVERHDALRIQIRFEGGRWVQAFGEARHVPIVHEAVGAADAGETVTVLAGLVDQAIERIDIAAGASFAAAVAQRASGQTSFVALILHPLICDGFSWIPLLEDLSIAYRQRGAGEAVVLPRPTTPFEIWIERLVELAQSDGIRAEADYWLSQQPLADDALPRDGSGPNRWEDVESISLDVPAHEARSLLSEWRGRGARVNERLLAAWLMALEPWTGRQRACLLLISHGREETLFDGVDLSRTVGPFAIHYPVLLDATSLSPAKVPARVAAQLRAVPRSGIGFGLLRAFSAAPEAEALERMRMPELNFLFSGRVDFPGAALGPEAPFALSDHWLPISGGIGGERNIALQFNAWIEQESLVCNWRFSPLLHRPSVIESLAARFRAQLLVAA